MDTRHLKRIEVIQNLFSYSFGVTNSLPYPADEKTKAIIKYLSKIDNLIKSKAKKYPIPRIGKIHLAILRLAVYELVIEKKEPKKVIINEAVELAKEFGGVRSYAFVNGVLGKVVETA